MAISRADRALGDLLHARGRLTLEQLDEATRLAAEWNVRLIDVILARRWIDAEQVYRELAIHHQVPFVDLMKEEPDPAIVRLGSPDWMAQYLTVPIGRQGETIILATADPSPEMLLACRQQFGDDLGFCIATKFDLIWTLQSVFRDEQSHLAVFDLAEMDPVMSAQRVITTSQLVFLYALVCVILVGMYVSPVGTLIAINLVLTLFYAGNFIFKGVLVWVGGEAQQRAAAAIETEARLMPDDDLPVYTVLVPMFKEPEVLPILAHALRRLDYPLAKLDIKIVLEEIDHETINAARSMGLEGVFEIIRVPQSHPQTKPKACNYALRYARGDYLVIFDAEDKPEPDQLKKVLAAFRQSPPNTACVQCRLNYYNAHENWLTRMFTLDYSLWFDLMLPGLERLGVPIPLGGTSNHFRMDVLRELRAWDPFNVTEDADLGIRLTQKGYRVGVIDSTTYEEANVSIPNWIRQRSRWIKGYMQTLLVHTRRPVHLFNTIGLSGVIGFVFFIGGTCISGIVNPLFWTVFISWLFIGSEALSPFFPLSVLYISLFNLLAGNGLLIYLTMVAPFRRRWVELAPWGISVIGYWVLMTIAAYKALGQLIWNPFYWEKTQHGLSKHTASEVAAAEAV